MRRWLVTLSWPRIPWPAVPRRLLLACYAPAVVLLAATALAAAVSGTPPSHFTRDPAVLLDASPLVGLVSQAGMVLWAATAAITLFTAAILGRRHPAGGFLLSAGLLTSWLLLDDMFMFHDWLFPEVLGIRQRYVLAGYVALTALLLGRFLQTIVRTSFPALLLALLFFCCSVGIDQLPDRWFRWDPLYLIEDGAKLLGIVSWFAYFAGVCQAALQGMTEPVRSTAPHARADERSPAVVLHGR